MNNPNDNSQDKEQQNDLRLIKLALAAIDPPEDIGPCLSDTDMADLVENRVKGPKKEALFRHLCGCDRCYQQYYDATADKARQRTLGRERPAVTLTPDQKSRIADFADQRSKTDPPNPFAGVIDLIHRYKKKIAVLFAALPVAAAAGLLCIYIGQIIIDNNKPAPALRLTEAQAQETRKVYARVAAVADKPNGRMPQLKIVAAAKGPWIRVRPGDGSIELASNAVAACYKLVEPVVLRKLFIAFMLARQLGPEKIPADDRGFMYAGMAGFPVELLVEKTDGLKKLLNLWITRSDSAGIDQGGTEPGEGAESLQKRLNELTETLSFFEYGVRLAHFKKYEAALYFFQQTRKEFPSREVFNNIGYCYLQMAVERMDASEALRYWLPSILDLRSQINAGTKGDGRNPENDDTGKLLKKAIDAFHQAATADAAYWPAWLNLATALFYRNEFFGAQDAVEKASRLAPENSQIQITLAIINLHQRASIAAGRQAAFERLKALADKGKDLSARYNLAVLLHENGQEADATRRWKQVASELDRVPAPLRHSVKIHAHVHPEEQQNPDEIDPVKQWPWRLPIEPGTNLTKDAAAERIFTSLAEKVNFVWSRGKLYGQVRWSERDGTGYLKINDTIAMVVLRRNDLGSPADFSQLGPPSADHTAIGGRLLDYGNSCTLRIIEGRIREVWLMQP